MQLPRRAHRRVLPQRATGAKCMLSCCLLQKMPGKFAIRRQDGQLGNHTPDPPVSSRRLVCRFRFLSRATMNGSHRAATYTTRTVADFASEVANRPPASSFVYSAFLQKPTATAPTNNAQPPQTQAKAPPLIINLKKYIKNLRIR
jgi:hypothetical protein